MFLLKFIILFTCLINILGFTPFKSFLEENSQKLLRDHKGILAMDESFKTIGKRLDLISCENTAQNRNSYRKLLLECPEIENYISGCILSEDTFDQIPLPNKDILYGVKLDYGLTPFIGGFPNEMSSIGLDTLDSRCKKYYRKGARFAKWRTVFSIQEGQTPSTLMIHENCWSLARFARICQENGLVPIVEPEILMDGNHSIEQCALVQEKILKTLYSLMQHNNVHLEGTILKTSMTLPGIDNIDAKNENDIGFITNTILENSVPKQVPGIMFLSGGLSEVESTRYLFKIKKFSTNKNWKLSFSFGRALQHSCLYSWSGKKENIRVAQEALLSRAKKNSNALKGILEEESDCESKNLFIKNYKY